MGVLERVGSAIKEILCAMNEVRRGFDLVVGESCCLFLEVIEWLGQKSPFQLTLLRS